MYTDVDYKYSWNQQIIPFVQLKFTQHFRRDDYRGTRYQNQKNFINGPSLLHFYFDGISQIRLNDKSSINKNV